jgi:hypothetical protein
LEKTDEKHGSNCGGDGPVGEVLPLEQHYYVVAFGC